jgi:hypothetical protein
MMMDTGHALAAWYVHVTTIQVHTWLQRYIY